MEDKFKDMLFSKKVESFVKILRSYSGNFYEEIMKESPKISNSLVASTISIKLHELTWWLETLQMDVERIEQNLK